MANVFLRKKINNRIIDGHPWIYSNEIGEIEGVYQPGDIVSVFSSNGSFVGKGYINPKSQIKIRLLTRDQDEVIDKAFFTERIKKAYHYRQQLGYKDNCRIVYGESDDLPGLIIDKVNDYVIFQTLTLGIDLWKNTIIEIIDKLFSPVGIYERNDVIVREFEGLPFIKGCVKGNCGDKILLKHDDLQFIVDLEKGQKTGFFLDHQDNWPHIHRVVKDAEVLDAFCYTGTFAINAAKYGAKKVIGLDICADAIALAKDNAALNNAQEICEFYELNAFDILKNWHKEQKYFDTIILDPPVLTKSRLNLDKAINGYREINLRAMKLFRKGGFLITTCSSNLISKEQFQEIIGNAAKDAKKRIKQISYLSQSADHPILWNVPEMEYMKFVIIAVE